MQRWGQLACALGLALATITAGAQQTADKPAAQTAQKPQTSPSGHANNPYWNEHDRQLLFDFPYLAAFHDKDISLGPPKPGEDRVVFMGDSITQGWDLEKYFPGKPYVNRGISGQTTPQMLVRFRQDVIHLQPRVVVILAGTNDLAGNTGPETPEQIEDNLASMSDLAHANGIKVVLCSILPAYDYPWHPNTFPAHKIDEINTWLKNYAAEKGYTYVDFHTPMKDARDGLPDNLSKDGVHPKPAGFEIMSKLVETGIEKALQE
ncbi:MAG TPA: SGNH/GDSL hydrolase family protein [Terracidiphilus sp.]|nr:SGNH/GDSL hydrolase family protein [Terracidiphilus sp.]